MTDCLLPERLFWSVYRSVSGSICIEQQQEQPHFVFRLPKFKIQNQKGFAKVEGICPGRKKLIKKKKAKAPHRRRSTFQLDKMERNALTNIGNLLLTYLSASRRCGQDIQRLFPSITKREKAAYFKTIKNQKKEIGNYVSQEKLLNLWHPVPSTDHLHSEIVRTLSHYYLRDQLVPAIITSKRLLEDYKPLHLSMRRKILQMLSPRALK